MSVLCLNVYRLRVPHIMYYELRCMFYEKNCTSSKSARLLDTASKFAFIFGVRCERRKVD